MVRIYQVFLLILVIISGCISASAQTTKVSKKPQRVPVQVTNRGELITANNKKIDARLFAFTSYDRYGKYPMRKGKAKMRPRTMWIPANLLRLQLSRSRTPRLYRQYQAYMRAEKKSVTSDVVQTDSASLLTKDVTALQPTVCPRGTKSDSNNPRICIKETIIEVPQPSTVTFTYELSAAENYTSELQIGQTITPRFLLTPIANGTRGAPIEVAADRLEINPPNAVTIENGNIKAITTTESATIMAVKTVNGIEVRSEPLTLKITPVPPINWNAYLPSRLQVTIAAIALAIILLSIIAYKNWTPIRSQLRAGVTWVRNYEWRSQPPRIIEPSAPPTTDITEFVNDSNDSEEDLENRAIVTARTRSAQTEEGAALFQEPVAQKRQVVLLPIQEKQKDTNSGEEAPGIH